MPGRHPGGHGHGHHDDHGHAHDHGHDHAHGHDHGHGHGHGHAHGPGHSHAPRDFGTAFAVGTTLNIGIVALQVWFGIAAGSMALLADAVHNFGDVLGLLAAWAAAVLARRVPSRRRTYGWGRGTILASLGNAVLLLMGSGAIALEAAQRFANPAPVASGTVVWVAAAGIAINGATALMFLRGRHDDLNIRGAFLHMAADALVSAGVVAAGVLIGLTGWQWLDPLTSLAIVAVIVAGTWGLLRESAHLAMDGVPPGIDLAAVHAALRALPGVEEVHDLHVWSLSTTESALTAHLVGTPQPETLLPLATARMRDRFGIGHATFQLETQATAATCALRPDTVI